MLPAELRIEGAGGTQLGMLDYGDPGDAPPLLLLHGIRDLAWSMDPIAQALRDRYRVLSLDLRGHGTSEHPGGYTFPLYAADLHCVLDRLGIERATLVGHSLGGQIVCAYAGLFPERVRALVTIEGLGPPRRAGRRRSRGASRARTLGRRDAGRSRATVRAVSPTSTRPTSGCAPTTRASTPSAPAS